eukprot:GHVU01096521.1.p1 GENE.GHVU01096521.1~~GHVU01096521.1.p1  ORF type:complete len:133 (-),score=0.83 GHVU01096521.1:363-761(-)
MASFNAVFACVVGGITLSVPFEVWSSTADPSLVCPFFSSRVLKIDLCDSSEPPEDSSPAADPPHANRDGVDLPSTARYDQAHSSGHASSRHSARVSSAAVDSLPWTALYANSARSGAQMACLALRHEPQRSL